MRDGEVERRLLLNGMYEHPLVTKVADMKAIELQNNQALLETIQEFQPDVVQVFSLNGISKSLIFTLRNSRVPTVYDVYDHWLSANVAEDPWLRFWNAPSLGFMESSTRTALEMSGERGRLDVTAPTRMMKGYERIPALYGDAKARAAAGMNSIAGFRFDRMYFCSQALKTLTEQSGFCIGHAEIIHPCIPAPSFIGEIKPTSVPMTRFLVVAQLNKESGVMTALKALKIVRAAKINATRSIYGKGTSEYIASLRTFVISNQLPVEFLGVSNLKNDLPAIYKRHDVLLHTPEWAEPFPFTPLEAMACGIPVIGSTAGGAEELLRHGENALTFPPGDENQLAYRIQEMQISPALRCQMAEAAQQEVLSKFNDSTVIDQIENFLNVSQETWAHNT